MIKKPNVRADSTEITSTSAIGFIDQLGREVLYCSSSNNAVILKADGGITIAENFTVKIFDLEDKSEKKPFIKLTGNYIHPNMSLKGGGKIYISPDKKVRTSKTISNLNYDHLGNLLIRRAHSSYWDYTSKPYKIKYRFGENSILIYKFEIAIIKRKHKVALARR
jgi:hypothetical protein